MQLATPEPTAAREPSAAPPPFGCVHYARGCKLRAPCCGELFSCRFCHDLAKSEAEADDAKKHVMDRHKVETVVCLRCDEEQPAAAECAACGARFGAYFCGVCHLYDDDLSKQQFHCDQCGICRVGGRANFFHCDTCGACYSVELRDNHVCVPSSMRRDCPICYEYLFDSLEAPQVLRCGHTIHRKCLESYSAHGGYTCPLCNASVCDMHAAWRYLDEEIRRTPMPEEYAGKVVPILCNDCHAHGDAPFHALGLKCAPCGSYNTRRL
jgi:RING finger/CHY zinc finger protein 1